MFRKKQKEKEKKQCDYPLSQLSRYVGKQIEVKYLNQDIIKTETAFLMAEPNEEFFYLKKDAGFHIIHWNRKDAGGKMDRVIRISEVAKRNR